ncbi:MAG: OB-fold nucleic acid binding domain-containing protein [Anaerolineales bacterium]|nr:OB-fold nucleic acid binding domain-containing protein [Anaerolineales bacterium]
MTRTLKPTKTPKPSATPTATVTPVPIAVLKTWPVGAWVELDAVVIVPPGPLGARVLVVQDATGSIPVYLGRGAWPSGLVPGNGFHALGQSRLRGDALEFYVRLLPQARFSPPGAVPAPLVIATGAASQHAYEVVTVTGRVTRLESSAFWIDDGSGAVRIPFGAANGLKRPKVSRGETVTITGLVIVQSQTTTRPAGWQIQPRGPADVGALAVLRPTSTPKP